VSVRSGVLVSTTIVDSREWRESSRACCTERESIKNSGLSTDKKALFY